MRKTPSSANWRRQDPCHASAPPHPTAPPLLRADRAYYQIASATFYAKQFDEAARQFAAIATDSSSPWSAMGRLPRRPARLCAKPSPWDKQPNPYSGDRRHL